VQAPLACLSDASPSVTTIVASGAGELASGANGRASGAGELASRTGKLASGDGDFVSVFPRGDLPPHPAPAMIAKPKSTMRGPLPFIPGRLPCALDTLHWSFASLENMRSQSRLDRNGHLWGHS
jgi:hypothetical protein